MDKVEFSSVKNLYDFYSNYKNLSILDLWNELDDTIREKIKVHKGMAGEIFEGLSGRPPNSSKEPDIGNLGIDLKVIPVRELKKGGYTVKERSKITSINYSKLRSEKWQTSKLKYKSNILFNVYEVPHGCHFSDLAQMKFFGPILFFIDKSEYLHHIKGDWEKIKTIVHNLKAHTLSTSITKMLEASTSGTGVERVYHPKAPKAIERSFAYKPRLLKLLFYDSMGKYKEKEEFSESSFKVDVFDLINKNFANKSIGRLTNDYGINYSKNKSFIHQLLRKVLKISENQEIRELHQENISIKTVPLNPENNYPWEAMSFPKISLADLPNEKWSIYENSPEWESQFKMQLMEKFIFLPIYKMKIKIRGKKEFVHADEWIFGKPKKWIFNELHLNSIGKEWNVCRDMIVKNMVKTKRVPWGKKTRQLNNLPKMSKTNYIHIRPHTSDSENIDEPYRKYTKDKIRISWQSFWLNKDFVNKIINNKL